MSNNDDVSPFAKTKQIADLYLADALEPVPTIATANEPMDFVNLPPTELENKIGAYRLLSEGRIWNLAVMDGDLHVIDPLNKAWRLKPLSATRFRPVGDTPFYESARFLFKRDTPGQPFSMTLESNENGFREVIDFSRVALTDLAPEKLIDYAGEYLNDELAATYRFTVKDGALWLRVGPGAPGSLGTSRSHGVRRIHPTRPNAARQSHHHVSS